jgi:hypothetical protein
LAARDMRLRLATSLHAAPEAHGAIDVPFFNLLISRKVLATNSIECQISQSPVDEEHRQPILRSLGRRPTR